ncbi:MAG TPA: Gfo/Idh/MocA family oxidoreductase, partial [Candidatus Glassbacteria bacterium]|nr:Gfo/Idh/MocA family oxidoreductase [Candidatus Glassbacteria bacterium]
MEKDKSLNRREFLGKTALFASAASLAAGAGKSTRAQINNTAGKKVERLGVGFIGVGIRGTLLLEGSLSVAGVDAVVACDLYDGHLERAKEITNGKIQVTKSYEEVLARKDIEAVVIAAPDHWHKKIVLDAFDAGKNVYVEKPLTHKVEDGEELIAAAKKSGKVVQVGSQYMSMSCAQKAVDLIKSGRLGQITLVDGKIHRNSSTGAWYYPIPPDANPQTVDWKRFIGDSKWYEFDLKRFFQWRLFWDYSGGLPTDLFVHLVTATHQLTGVTAPEKVVSFGDIYRWKNYRDVPDQMTAIASYPEGFVLKLTSTANNGHPGPALTFYGTEGTLEYDGDSMTYYYEPRTENFRYPTHSWATPTVKQFQEIMNLNADLSPVKNPPPKQATA